MDKQEICETCKFAQDYWAYDTLLCRKRSPKATKDRCGEVKTIWPEVRTRDWCGEYERKTETPRSD